MQPFERLSSCGQIGRLKMMARAALRAYALPATRLVVLRHEHNTTSRVETAAGEHYVLRLHRPGQHSPRAVRSETLWLEALCRFFALRRLQLLICVLESRAHPAFAGWRPWSQDLLAGLKGFLTASTG